MKNILFILFVLLFSVVACVDDKTNLDYKDINGYIGNGGYKIEGINGNYTLFPGESLTLIPKVSLSKDTLNPSVRYSWLLNGKEVSTDSSYTFTAGESYGINELIFNAIDKETGVAFPQESEINVSPLYKLGWLFLCETAAGESRLDLLIAKPQKINYISSWGYPQQRDSLIFVQFETGLGERLGRGPIKLIEEYPDASVGELLENSEIMVLQESGPVELGGNGLTFTGEPFSEFIGDVPANLVVKDASLSPLSKWLHATDGRLYYSVASVVSDLHSGRYNDDPAFNGMKFERIIPSLKSYEYPADVVLAIDEEGTMWAFLDHASDNDGIINPQNEVGKKLRIENNVSGTYDMSLFREFKGERIKDCFVRTDDYFLSLLKKENEIYIWHKYLISSDSYDKGTDFVRLEESVSNQFASSEPFADFKDAAYEYGGYDDNYNDRNWLFIASGNRLYGANMTWSETSPQTGNFFFTADAQIKAIKTRYIDDTDYVTVGVLMEDGTFQILNVRFDMKQRLFSFESVYKENLRMLDPEIKEIVDFIPKWGSGWNLEYGLCE